MSDIRSPSSLDRLVGEDVSSVTFVRDYVQVHFNRHVLTCYTLPAVQASQTDRPIRLGAPGYRDVLCSFIDKHVRAVAERPRDRLWVQFDDGGVISVSLRHEDASCVEAAMLHEAEGSIWEVWRYE